MIGNRSMKFMVAAIIAAISFVFVPQGSVQAAPVATHSRAQVVVQRDADSLNVKKPAYVILAKYKKGKHPAKVRFRNPNDYPVKLVFVDDDFKRLPNAMVNPHSKKVVKFRTPGIIWGGILLVDGQKIEIPGGMVNLSPR